jgi:hypothetical protein
LQTIRFHGIESKEVINPVNEVEVEAYGVSGVFVLIKFE